MAASAAGDDSVVMEGYLTKSPPLKRPDSKSISKWKQRYFVLKKGAKTLEYFQDRASLQPKGVIDLNRCWHISDSVPHRRHDFVFCIAVPERKFYMVAGSKAQRDSWVAKLKEVCKQPYRRLQSRGSSSDASVRACSVPSLVHRRESASSSDEDTVSTFRHPTAPGRNYTPSWSSRTSGYRSDGDDFERSVPRQVPPPKPPKVKLDLPDTDSGHASTDVDGVSLMAKLNLDDPAYIPGCSTTDVIELDPGGRIDYSKPISVTAELHDELLRVVVDFPNLSYCAFADDEIMESWRIQDLRRYAQRGNVFEFEAGRNCPSGEGLYSITLEEDKNLEEILDQVLQLHSNPDNKKEIASEAEQPTGYELLSFHNGQPQIGGQTPDKYRDAASTQLATTGTMRRAYSEEQLPTVEYTKIDELKTQALHSAMSQHKRGDASFTARMTADSDDEFGFGFGPGEDGLAQTKSSSSLDSAMASHSNSLNGSVRSGASHSSDGLRQKRKQLRRYVNVSNSQLSVMLNQERRSNGAVTSTIMDEEEEEEESDSDNDVEPRAGQSTSLVDEIDRLCAELSDESD